MKKALLFSLILTISLSLTIEAKERIYEPLQEVDGSKQVEKTKNNTTKSKSNTVQMSEFVTFDSLANTLSYYHPYISPFAVDPETGTIFTIMRGSEPDPDGSSSHPLSKNNLFIRYTTDNGVTWSEKETVYNYTNSGLGQGRYPSIYLRPMESENSFVLNFSAPLVDEQASEWFGYVLGLSIFSNGSYQTGILPAQGNVEVNGNTYFHGRYTFNEDFGIFGKFSPPGPVIGYGDGVADFRAFAPFPLARATLDAEAPSDNHNTSITYTDDFGSINTIIPEKFESDNFAEVDSVQKQRSLPYKLREGDDGNTYLFMLADFADDEYDSFRLSLTKSTDEGNTWSDFDLFPRSVIDDYVDNEWDKLNSNQYLLATGFSIDFHVNDEDNYSYFAFLSENTDSTGKQFFVGAYKRLVELYKKNGEYGIRTIAEEVETVPNTIIDQNNDLFFAPMDYEMQVARTFDGSKYFLKYVQLTDLELDTASGNSFSFSGNEFMITTKDVDGDTWIDPISLSSNIYIKGSWIPPFVPNDLDDIMVFSMITQGDPQNLDVQRRYVEEQYMRTARISSDDLVNVETKKQSKDEPYIKSIYPNPADKNVMLEFYSTKNTKAKIDISNGNGSVVMSFESNEIEKGINYIDIDTQNFSQGTYYIKVTLDGFNVSDIMNVIR